MKICPNHQQNCTKIKRFFSKVIFKCKQHVNNYSVFAKYHIWTHEQFVREMLYGTTTFSLLRRVTSIPSLTLQFYFSKTEKKIISHTNFIKLLNFTSRACHTLWIQYKPTALMQARREEGCHGYVRTPSLRAWKSTFMWTDGLFSISQHNESKPWIYQYAVLVYIYESLFSRRSAICRSIGLDFYTDLGIKWRNVKTFLCLPSFYMLYKL